MADEMKIAILQYQMGRHYQKVLANFGLTDEESKNYSTVVQKFDKYFEPKVLTASNINKFQNCKQKVAQSINEYITELQDLSKLCDFGAKEDDFLSVQICNGDTLRKKLWGENLNLAQIIEKCQLHELKLTRLWFLHKRCSKKKSVSVSVTLSTNAESDKTK